MIYKILYIIVVLVFAGIAGYCFYRAYDRRKNRSVIGLPGSYCIGIWKKNTGWIRYLGK